MTVNANSAGTACRSCEGAAASLLRDIEALVAFGPRLAGSPAERLAAGYIADELRSAGLAPEVLEFDGYISQPAAHGRLVIPDGCTLAGKGVAFAASTPPGGLTARMARLDDPGRLDGAIALVEGLPHHAVLLAAASRGAVAVIAISKDNNAHYWQISPLWGSPAAAGQIDRFAPIPALQIRRSDGIALEDLRQRGAVVTLFAEVNAGWKRLSMPTVQIDGHEPGYLLVGGHFCSWGPGASDNAAGNALMLDLARHYAKGPKPRFGLRLAWWTGHEQGGYAGSSHFSDLYHGDLSQNAIGYLSVDNVGSRGAHLWLVQNTGAELDAFANRVRNSLVKPLSPAQSRFATTLHSRADQNIPASRPARNGDQSFSGIGLPSFQIASWLDDDNPDRIPGTGLPWWWHTDDDKPERCGADVLETDLAIHHALVDGLINAAALPLDPLTQAHDLVTVLSTYRDAASAICTLDQLLAEAELYRQHLAGPRLPERTALALVKRLNSVLFHAVSPTEFDMTRESRLLPGLQPALLWADAGQDEQRMIEISVLRAANRISQALSDCRVLLGR